MTGLRSRQEKFCQYYVVYACASAAAREAGYSPPAAARQGYRLMRSPRIQARIADIQATLAEAHCRRLDVLLGKLEAVYLRALKDHKFYAAARAVELQARLSGLGGRGGAASLDEGDDGEAAQAAASLTCVDENSGGSGVTH